MSGYPIAIELGGASVLVVGADEGAFGRAKVLAQRGARVTVVTHGATVDASAAGVSARVYVREATARDVRGMKLVVQVLRDPELARELLRASRSEGALFCAEDDPKHSDFSHLGIVRRGPLELTIGTGGAAPFLVRILKRELERELGKEMSDFTEEIARVRRTWDGLSMEARRTASERLLEGFRLRVGVDFPSWFASRKTE
jgi:siroheme synthase-like protein